MKICGIVAEYNPLHLGHKYQLETAKKLSGADCIAVVMSGNYVQRGEPAVTDKFSRARAAVFSGADIVIELPVFYSLSSAEIFADGAVSLLRTIGADSICFGAETNDYRLLSDAAHILIDESEEYKAELNRCLSQGLSYPAARQAALAVCSDTDLSSVISKPNNILAIEYIKAAARQNYSVGFIPVLRAKTDYNDIKPTGEFSSALAIRNMIKQHADVSAYLTEPMSNEFTRVSGVSGPIFIDDFSSIFRHKMLFLKRISAEKNITTDKLLCMYHDISDDLAHRLVSAYDNNLTISEYATAVKSKNYTYSRICRCIMHIILGITKDTANYYMSHKPPYMRVLGFNKTGQSCLNQIKKSLSVPLITKPADYKEELALDLACSDIYNTVVFEKFGHMPDNELKNGAPSVNS